MEDPERSTSYSKSLSCNGTELSVFLNEAAGSEVFSVCNPKPRGNNPPFKADCTVYFVGGSADTTLECRESGLRFQGGKAIDPV